jgi:bacteriorhodopsin
MQEVLVLQYLAFAIFVFVAVIMLVKGNFLLALIPAVAGMAYFSMIHDRANKETYRYMDWAVTTPLMLVAILSANKLPDGAPHACRS